MTEDALGAKRALLAEWLIERQSVLVGFSGGVDSALLAVTAHDVLGSDNVLAVLGISASLADEVRHRASVIMEQFGVPFREVETHEFENSDYLANRGDRCFHCKSELWACLVPVARESGLGVVVDGTIVDDLGEHRPGLAAGVNAGVESPLADCGFTKADVRELARLRGIPIWDAPAAPCLSSRIKTGIAVEPHRLLAVDRAESNLRSLGIVGDLRVRHLGDAARIELPAGSLDAWHGEDSRRVLATAVHNAGFTRVFLDRSGYRRGALQERGSTEVTDITVAVASEDRDTST
jgi:uncharacterized protein